MLQSRSGGDTCKTLLLTSNPAVGSSQGHPELENLRRNYYRWLTETGQDEKAGEVKESQGDFQGAVNLYLKAGLPAKAARLAISQPEISSNSDTVSRIAAGLLRGEFYERVSPVLLLGKLDGPTSGFDLLVPEPLT